MRRNCKSTGWSVGYLALSLFLSGCVSMPAETEILTEERIPYTEPDRVGVYHKVKKGQTIWRIAKAYEVAISDIIETNNIPDIAQVEENQLVFIPGVTAVQDIIVETKIDHDEDFDWPVKGRILHYYKSRSGHGVNKGIDIKAQAGETVKASRGGNVVFADFLAGYGYTVILDHKDGYFSVYAQNSELLVKLDDIVNKAQLIARVGRNRTDESYLHFEIRRQTLEDNPLFYLPKT